MAYRRGMTSQSAVICLLIVGHYMSVNSSPSPSPSEPSVAPQVVTNASDDNAVPNTGDDSSSVPSMPITGSDDELSKTANTSSSGSDGQNSGDHSAPVVNDSKQPAVDPNRLPDIPVVELPSVPTPAPPNEMLSFEEWRKKIAEKAVHQQLRQQQQQQQQQQNGQLSAGVKVTGAQGGGGGQPLGSQASGATGTGQTSPEVVNGGIPLKPKPMASPKRTRNFASHECGAKIVDSNPESESVLRILNEQTDEYMLNPCKAKIWFVVELCETVQPNHIELANFELYSSVPKEFNIQSSDHYPTRDWSSLGTFQAQDERSEQRFGLQNTGFVKFVKIELLSHYGSEHFCPLSVVRVFGTSLFEEVERIDTLDANHLTATGVEEEESPIAEEMLGGEESAQNLFGTARDAVFNIVRQAAQALNGNSDDVLVTTINETNITQMKASVDDCVQMTAIRLYPKVDKYLQNCTKTTNHSNCCLYLKALFGQQLYSLMISQYLSVNNASNSRIGSTGLFQCNAEQTKPGLTGNNDSINVESSLVAENFGSIVPTKPIMDDWAAAPVSNAIDSSVPSFNSASIVDTVATFARSTPSSTSVMASHVLSGDVNDAQQLSTDDAAKGEPTVQTLSNDSSSSEASKSPPVSAEDILPIVSTNNETNGVSDELVNNITTGEGLVAITGTQSNGQQVVATNGQNTAPVNGQPLNGNNNVNGYISNGATIGQTKESVVIRLSNRIKALEVNLSLSSQYLEQLSQRYRKQMEEMQKAFNITISKLNDTNIRAAERDLKQQESIAALETKLNTLSAEMSALIRDREDLNWHYIEVHIALMMVEVIIVIVFLVMFGHRLSQRIHFAAQTHQIPANGSVVGVAIPPAALLSPNKRTHPYGSPCHLPTKSLKIEDENKPPEVLSNNKSATNAQRKIRKKKRKAQSLNAANPISQSLESPALLLNSDPLKCMQFESTSKDPLILKSQSTPALTTGNASVTTSKPSNGEPFGAGLTNEACSSCHSSTSGVSSNSTLSTNILKTNHLSLNSSPKNEIKMKRTESSSSCGKKSFISRNKGFDNKTTNSLTLSLKKLLKFDRKVN